MSSQWRDLLQEVRREFNQAREDMPKLISIQITEQYSNLCVTLQKEFRQFEKELIEFLGCTPR